jgi:hypothetical protein
MGSDGQPTAGYAYAGVVNSGGQSLVYAVVAVGEGYVDIALG